MPLKKYKPLSPDPYINKIKGDTEFARLAHLNNLVDQINNQGGGASYKVYTALLNQSGTDAPVATVLENTLGGTPVWTRSSTGNYICTLTGAFTLNKTFCSAMYGTVWGNGALSFNFGVNDNNSIVLSAFSYDAGGLINYVDFNNNPGNDICVEIRVYP